MYINIKEHNEKIAKLKNDLENIKKAHYLTEGHVLGQISILQSQIDKVNEVEISLNE